MGGQGSGRHKSPETIMKEQFMGVPIAQTAVSDIFLPNYSGLKDKAVKTNPSTLATLPINLVSDVTETLPIDRGGTNNNIYTTNALLYYDSEKLTTSSNLTFTSNSLNIESGSLYLPSTTTSTSGVIYKNNSRYLHDYVGAGQEGQNIFVGINSGNFTMSGTTFQSSYNMGFGSQTLTSLTTGSGNVAIGYFSLRACTAGNTNMGIGASSLRLVTTNSFNVALGGSAGFNTTGANNVLIGYQAGFTGTSFSSNVFIGLRSGYYETGSNKLFIDNQSRTDEATSRISSLVYGEFNSTIASQLFRVNGKFEIGISKTPSSASATGTAGEICWDTNYIYVCTATNTWKRVAISTW